MAKKSIKKETKTVQKNLPEYGLSSEVKNFIIVSISVLLFFGLFYFITMVILGGNNSSKNGETADVEVQHKEILVGTSFSVKDSQYYVLYYEAEDDDISYDMASLISKYRSANQNIPLYTVDMSNALNSSFKSDEANRLASKASELKIAGPTLINFVDGKIDKYVEGIDNIKEILK